LSRRLLDAANRRQTAPIFLIFPVLTKTFPRTFYILTKISSNARKKTTPTKKKEENQGILEKIGGGS
jgi:hypothetical protein